MRCIYNSLDSLRVSYKLYDLIPSLCHNAACTDIATTLESVDPMFPETVIAPIANSILSSARLSDT